MVSKVKVLMTGAGAPGGPGIIKSLILDKNIELHVCDANPKAIGRFLLPDRFYKIPKANHHDFISEIIKLCLKLKIDIILPLVTRELFEFSKKKNHFQSLGIEIIVSEFKSLEIANDKGNLYRHLSNNNIQLPKYEIVDNALDLKKAVIGLGYPKSKVVIKPCMSNGSRGIRILDKNKDKFKLLFEEKPNSIFDNLENILNILSKNKIPRMLVSEYLPGEELTVDTIIRLRWEDTCLGKASIELLFFIRFRIPR